MYGVRQVRQNDRIRYAAGGRHPAPTGILSPMADRLTRSISADSQSPDPLGASQSVPKSLRLPRGMLLGLTIIYLGLGEFFVIRLAESSRQAAANTLESRAQAVVGALDRVADRDKNAALTAAGLPEVRLLLAASQTANPLPAPLAREMLQRLAPMMQATRIEGIALLDARGRPLRFAGDDPVAVATLPTIPAFVQAARAERAAFSEVVPAGIPSTDATGSLRDSVPVLFVGAGARDAEGELLGVVVFRVRPSQRIDPILRTHRVGRSADPIVFRRDGLAVSATRYDAALAEAGVIPAGQSASLQFRLLDPDQPPPVGPGAGTSAQRVLTRAVSAALRGEAGSDAHGYRNARGEEVVGAWAFSSQLGVGVVYELDRAEALQQYFVLRNIYWALGLGIIFANTAAWRGLRTARRLRDQRKRAEHALLERDRTLNAIIDSSPNAVLVLDASGCIIRHNDAADRLFRRPSHAVLGDPISRYVRSSAEVDPADVVGFLDAASREAEGMRADDSTYPIEVRWAPFDVQSERLYTVILIDVTARKETERALIAARDEAEAAARAKSEFLAMMSHEIRTPMNGVLGMTSLLADTELSAEQRQFVDATRRSADLLMSVINDILDFSKVEAGKMTIEPIPFDLQSAVAEVAELLVPRATEKKVELVIRIDPTTPTRVVGDSGRIRQVLLNLTGNALKFTETGHVLISVDGRVDGAAAALRFEVTDTGIGIAARVIPTLFNPFMQADASTTRRFGGTGLGLSISKRLVELMGGTIGVTSVEGKGSTFWFTLSLPVDTSPVPAQLPPVTLGGLRGLVVDDVDINVRLLMEWMRNWGMRVDSAPDAERALTMLREAKQRGDPYRIAIIDYLMPRMDGEMLGRAVRADATIADTLLVIATSAAQRGDADRFQAAEFDAYLTKPFRSSVVAAACEAVLSRGPRAPGPIITRHTLIERSSRLAPGADPVSRSADGAPSIRVLLAEDNPVNQMVAVRMLERFNCRIDIANDGVEAVRMAEEFGYDVIFMDVQMPNLDGLEATRRIRAAGAGRNAYIVAMTANAMQGDRELCIDAGMDDYVAKPVTPESLRQALEKRSTRRGRQPRV
jgi:PAS domain S-box-containing protein